MFTVKDLIAHLKTLDPNLPVGRVGHFGEFYGMEVYDFYTRHTLPRTMSWATQDSKYEGEVLHIEPPDIGEDPE